MGISMLIFIKNILSFLRIIIINILFSIENYLFETNLANNYDNLMIALIGGELTLITLFFSLVPILIEKNDKNYYLGYKITDFFLYNNGQNDLVKTFIQEMSLIIINIIFCYFKLNRINFIIFFIFMYYLIRKIVNYLIFISDKSETIAKIEKKFIEDVNKDADNALQELLKKSTDIKIIYENLNFLFNNNNLSIEILFKYISLLLASDNTDKQAIYFKLKDFIMQKKYHLNYFFDGLILYEFLSNSLNDYNKEKYYEFMIILLLNNYNCCISEGNNLNLCILFLKVIEDSKLSEDNKVETKNRMLNNLYLFLKANHESGDAKHFRIFKYKFEILKYIIDCKDKSLFNKFLRMNNIHGNKISYDLFMTCYLYFYYLIIKEKEKYVSKSDKKIYQDMYKKLKDMYDFNSYLYIDYYYNNLNVYFNNLDNIYRGLEKFNLEDGYDVKASVVDEIVDNFKKAIVLAFDHDMANNKYKIDDLIFNLFKYDFKKGNIKEEIYNEITNILNFLGYNLGKTAKEKFEKAYLGYVAFNYKGDELSKKIDIEKLSEKINQEKIKLEETISKLSIFNNKKCKKVERFSFKVTCNRDVLDSIYLNRDLLNSLNLEEELENYIYDCIMKDVKHKITFDFKSENIILENLKKAKKNLIYLRPQNDYLGKTFKFGDDYENCISKFKIVDTSVLNTLFLLESYNCIFKNIKVELQEIDDKFLLEKEKEYYISKNRYCITNDFGIEIFYNKKELESYLKNTEVVLNIDILFGLDVIGKDNIAFINTDL